MAQKVAVSEDDRRRDEDDTHSLLQLKGVTARLPRKTFFLLFPLSVVGRHKHWRRGPKLSWTLHTF